MKTARAGLVAGLLLAGLPIAGHADSFMLTSPQIADGQTLPDAQVFNAHGCTGDNISPALSWSVPPAGTKSFAITAFDPDAHNGAGWWHWIVFDIPAATTALPLDAGSGKNLPPGALQGRTSFGKPSYSGACPPPGVPHHYVFTVYALGVDKIQLSLDADPATDGLALRHASLASASITALYGR